MVSGHDRRPQTVAGGFAYTECPRWRDGRLWFWDQYLGWVYAMTAAGEVEPVNQGSRTSSANTSSNTVFPDCFSAEVIDMYGVIPSASYT